MYGKIGRKMQLKSNAYLSWTAMLKHIYQLILPRYPIAIRQGLYITDCMLKI